MMKKMAEVRLIDANALEEIMQHQYEWLRREYTQYDHYTAGYGDAANEVTEAPTISPDSLRPKGRWVMVKPRRMGRNATYKCTACGKLRSSYYNDVQNWEFCPCGADMRGENK